MEDLHAIAFQNMNLICGTGLIRLELLPDPGLLPLEPRGQDRRLLSLKPRTRGHREWQYHYRTRGLGRLGHGVGGNEGGVDRAFEGGLSNTIKNREKTSKTRRPTIAPTVFSQD